MEFSPRVVAEERVLTAVVLAAALAAALLERRSPVAAAVREGRSYEFALTETAGAGRSAASAHLLPAARTLWVVGADPLEAKRALVPVRPSAWRTLGDVPPLDRALLIIELARMSPDRVHAAWPAETQADRLILEGAIALAPAGPPATPTAEVLNGSSVSGVAAAVRRRLRDRGIDVLESGNAPEIHAHTVVYDRVARPAAALQVLAALGCPSAEAVTRVDSKRLVDASVVVGEDCAADLRKPLAAETEKN